jgi:two-component system phosphate regulon sensor histidine kinase PhoR
VALDSRRYKASLPDNVTVAAAPVFGSGKVPVRGAVIVLAEPPPALSHAFDELRGDRLRALLIAIAIGVLVGFLTSSLIAIRVRRLARSAEQMAAGDFEAALPPGGGDEIGDLTRSLDTMRQELRQTFDMLATERDRLSAIFHGLTEAVIVVGEDGQVRFTNPAAGRLVRNGKPAPALIPSLHRAAEHGADEIPVLSIDGRVYGVQARRVPAEHAVLLVVRDRTEELKREQAEAEFVSNAAHELRNPLAGIMSGIEVLRGGAKDDLEARDRFLDRLAFDAERMTRLTQSLLMLARAEAAGQRDPAQVVDVALAAYEALEAVETPAGVELLDEVEPDLVAEGDPVLLRQVMIGLLSNACAYTPAPGTVTLRAARGEEKTVNIEVEDTGKGIPPEEQDRVFERFYRGSATLGSEGFGLGLSIAKRMVQVMGGDIGVRSEPGQGSTFWVRLRAAKPTPTPVA